MLRSDDAAGSSPETIVSISGPSSTPSDAPAGAGSSATSGTPVTVSATAAASTPGATISSVQFFASGVSIGTDNIAPYTVTWTPSGTGVYTLTAVATDSNSTTSTSPAVSFTVTSVGGGGGSNSIRLAVGGNPEELDTGMQLAYLLLTEPKIEKAAFDQWKAATLLAIAQREKDVGGFMGKVSAETIYPTSDVRTQPLTKEQVNKDIEAVRAEGKVGASLQAEVTVSAQAEDLALLQSLEDDLKFVFITSAARAVAGDGDLGVEVRTTTHEKCGRCWHHRADVGRRETLDVAEVFA